MTVQQIMTAPIKAISVDGSLAEAATAMRDHDIGFLPVALAGKHVHGVLSDRDIVIRAVAEGLDPTTTSVRDCATKAAYCVRTVDPIQEAAKRMAESRVRRLLVVDLDGDFVGVVSLADLAKRTTHARLPGEVLGAICRDMPRGKELKDTVPTKPGE
jgi:CBS domain-containing protein